MILPFFGNMFAELSVLSFTPAESIITAEDNDVMRGA
jgi:hypothetical protein